MAYENIYTKQRQADVPTDPALKDATYAITSGINVMGDQRSLMLTQVWSDEFTSALHSYVDAWSVLSFAISYSPVPDAFYGVVTGEITLPMGWRQVASQSRAGAMSFENIYTKQRQADVPMEPALQNQSFGYLNISASSLATSATTHGM